MFLTIDLTWSHYITRACGDQSQLKLMQARSNWHRKSQSLALPKRTILLIAGHNAIGNQETIYKQVFLLEQMFNPDFSHFR